MNDYRSEHKNFYIQPHKDHPTCYTVATVGKGGKIPDCLSGLFTTRAVAKSEIDTYVNSRPTKEKNSGETLSESRGK